MVVTLVNFQWNTSILLVWIDLSVLKSKRTAVSFDRRSRFRVKIAQVPELSDIFYCGLFARKSTLRSVAQFTRKRDLRSKITSVLLDSAHSDLSKQAKLKCFTVNWPKLQTMLNLENWNFQPFPNINGCNFGQFSVKHFNFVVWIDLSTELKEQLIRFRVKIAQVTLFWGHLRNFNSKTRPPIKGYLCSFRLSTLRSIHTSKIEVFHCKLTKVHNHVYLKHWKFQPFPNINGCNFGQFSVKHFNFVCVNRSEYAEYKRTVKSFDLR